MERVAIISIDCELKIVSFLELICELNHWVRFAGARTLLGEQSSYCCFSRTLEKIRAQLLYEIIGTEMLKAGSIDDPRAHFIHHLLGL